MSDTQIDSIQYLNFGKKLLNSIFNSIVFHENSIQKIIQFNIFHKKSIQKIIQFKNLQKKFNSKKYSIKKFATKIQFKIWFKMLNLAGFNSTIYSFNKKTGVSFTPIPSSSLAKNSHKNQIPKYVEKCLKTRKKDPLEFDLHREEALESRNTCFQMRRHCHWKARAFSPDLAELQRVGHLATMHCYFAKSTSFCIKCVLLF